jgi:signal transduction histidine kinase
MALLLFGIGSIICLFAYVSGLFFPNQLQILNHLQWTLCSSLGAVLAWNGYAKTIVWKRSRMYYAIGVTSHAVGQWIWEIQFLHPSAFFPGASEIFFILSGLLILLGVIASLKIIQFPESIHILAIDGFSISLICQVLVLLRYRPTLEESNILQMFVFIALPVLFFCAFSFLLIVLLAYGLRSSIYYFFFLIGCLNFGLLWLEWNAFLLENNLKEGMILSYGFSISSLLLGLSSNQWELRQSLLPKHYISNLRFLPILTIMFVGFLILYIGLMGQYSISIKLIVAIISILILILIYIRQLLQNQDTTHTESNLRSLNLELEAIVLQRTNDLMLSNESLKRKVEELKDAQTKVVQSEKLSTLGQLVGTMAHEINTPLGAISSSNSIFQISVNERLESVIKTLRSLSEMEIEIWLSLYHLALKHEHKFTPQSDKNHVRILHDYFEGKVSNVRFICETLVDFGITESNLDRNLLSLPGERISEIVESVKPFIDMNRANLIIAESVERANKLIKSLRTYLHQTAYSSIEIVNLLNQFEDLIALYFEKHAQNMKIRIEIPSDILLKCYADELSQVWTNLINNSMYAMEFRGEIRITAIKLDNAVEVVIWDDGPGIPMEIQPRIFDVFFTTKKIGEGTGLGLTISKAIIEKHNGSIHFESKPRDTKFIVRLPL